MFRGVAVPFALFLAVVVVHCIIPSLAAPPVTHCLTHQELSRSIIINRLAILKGMNESTSFFASHGHELNQLREDMQKEWQAMNETVKDIKNMNETVNEWMAEMNAKMETVQKSAAVHHQRPDPADLYADHNDTFDSLCDGDKVLSGGRGGFTVTTSGNYTNNMNCSWTVTLPEGSRPVFSWYFFDIERCTPCNKCDYVYVYDPNHPSTDYYCGGNPPDGDYLTVMNNKFIVKFHSDDFVTGRGFSLWYRAVSMD